MLAPSFVVLPFDPSWLNESTADTNSLTSLLTASLCEVDALVDIDALVESLADTDALAESLADIDPLAESLADTDTLAESLVDIDALVESLADKLSDAN
ncbi:hypothetical protein [Staphylococcus delphini]|uniref:hypothetical protein n=1 Tax=Staphylococcus delphini TaxID=53344 RepID=UPI000F6E1224|nr:hypothetical protein [Staphylococcus delphini]VED61646.1 Uncharacterised protein [Staphylococcus delphini]